MCTNCGYHLQAGGPPERCPGCQQACLFNNVTCYHPECGGEGNIDPLLVGATLKAMAGTPQQARSRAVPVMEALPTVYIFGSLTEEQRQRVGSLERTETYEADAIICKQGAEARKLYLVEEGQVAVECELQDGKRIPISSVSAGGAFGWSALVRPYLFTATCGGIVQDQGPCPRAGSPTGTDAVRPQDGPPDNAGHRKHHRFATAKPGTGNDGAPPGPSLARCWRDS